MPGSFLPCLDRGTATGGGTTRETNQRLAIAWQSFEWESSPEHNGKGPSSSDGGGGGSTDPFLDAAIVGESVRPLVCGVVALPLGRELVDVVGRQLALSGHGRRSGSDVSPRCGGVLQRAHNGKPTAPPGW